MIVFNKTYFILSLLLFFIEVFIAVFIHDAIVRPYIGDLLVVILLYCMIRSVLNVSVWKTCWFVLAFSFLIELLQYFNIVTFLGLQDYALARVVIGTSFQWIDLIAYTAGIIIVLLVESWKASDVK
ncbi:MAG: DUF2809 domain-containing protein [Azospira oryzae]|jgi:hypothetical protein|nr:MAG: DUF2809 domain-containing protein [Azospira oryzae]